MKAPIKSTQPVIKSMTVPLRNQQSIIPASSGSASQSASAELQFDRHISINSGGGKMDDK